MANDIALQQNNQTGLRYPYHQLRGVLLGRPMQ